MLDLCQYMGRGSVCRWFGFINGTLIETGAAIDSGLNSNSDGWVLTSMHRMQVLVTTNNIRHSLQVVASSRQIPNLSPVGELLLFGDIDILLGKVSIARSPVCISDK